MLADEFANFFTTSINTLHTGLLAKKRTIAFPADCIAYDILSVSSTKFSMFTEMKLEDIREQAGTLLSKSCVLDSLPLSTDY